MHEVDYSLLSTLKARYVFVMLYITDCQSCRLFEQSIHPQLVDELGELDVAFYKSNCEKQVHLTHFPAFVLHDRHTNAQVRYAGVLKSASMAQFIKEQVMKCTEARVVPYRRYTGGEPPTEEPVELDVFSFDDLKERARKTDKAFIVLFYADWCHQCTQFKPVFRQYTTENDDALFGTFKDNGKYTADLFKAEGVNAIPTVKIFYRQQTHEHRGSTTLASLRTFVRSHTHALQSVEHVASTPAAEPSPTPSTPAAAAEPPPSAAASSTSPPPPEVERTPWNHPKVSNITSRWQEHIQRMRDDDGCVVLFYSPTCPHCEKMRPVFFQVSEDEAHLQVATVDVGALSHDDRMTLASEDITSVPTIILYTRYASFRFDGEYDVHSIGRFVKHRVEQQQQTSNDRRGMLQIQGGGFLKPRSVHGQSLFLFPDNTGVHAQEQRARAQSQA